MLKMSVESVWPGAVLAKPIVNDAGISLIAAGVEVTGSLKEKLASMGVTEIFIAGKRVPDIPKEEFLAKVDVSFSKTEEDPRMAVMKRALLAHVEELY
ncbi:MAG TPA: hypothetical protein VKF36_17530 [Syntrophorhabdales bacterium]|nr:hypothetical protein [Syntrophorhabdales bacterium]